MKKWISFEFDESEPKKTLDESSKIIKNKLKPRYNETPKSKRATGNFEDKITPKCIDDLAVNKKKIDHVKQWLIDNVIQRKNNISILVVNGPTGCGKTITVNVLCKSMKIDVLEWINPISLDYEFEKGPSQAIRFLDFISESKYPSLITDNNKKIVLVEDFPNTFIRDNKEFHDILEKVIYYTKTPIVFICTETNNTKTNLYQILFPEEIRLKYNIDTISFNATSTTLLKNALKRAQQILQENSDVPSITLLEAIANSSLGDIRCAMNNYHIASLTGSNEMQTSQRKNKKRKRGGNITIIDSVLRDNRLGLFHLLGRILNPKRKEDKNTWRLDCNLNEIVDELATYPNSGLSFLQHNYLKYFGDFSDVCNATHILSQTLKFTERNIHSNELNYLGLWYCTSGFMIHNKHRVSKWNQIRAPKKLNNTTNDSNIMEGYYYDLIQNTNNYHKFCKKKM